jgi:protein SCO1/2
MTGDSANITRLTDAAGFYVMKQNGLWLHSGVLIAVSPTGKIARYLPGIQHLPFDVTMALYEAQGERTGPTIAKVMAFCFPYDPEGKRYAFDVVRVGGVVTVALVGVFAFFLLRKSKSKQAKA